MKTAERTGVALVLTVGILVLLSLSAVLMAGVAVQFRAVGTARLDQAQAGLLARSGVEFASARLLADAAPSAAPDAGNQSDDWAFRDPPDTALDRARNPSYAQTEPYADAAKNGRYDEGVDSFTDLNGNRALDAWSGRLRGRHGISGATFALRVGGNGGKVDVNGGLIQGADARKLDATRDPSVFTPPDKPAPYCPNKRLARILDRLDAVLTGASSSGAGDAVILGRPAGGYGSVEELRTRLAPDLYRRLSPCLTVRARRDPRTWFARSDKTSNGGKLLPDPRAAVVLSTASAEVLTALQRGLSCRVASEYQNGGVAPAYDLILPPEAWAKPVGSPMSLLASLTPIPTLIPPLAIAMDAPKFQLNLAPPDDAAVARFLVQGRPFAGRYDLFRKLDTGKERLFVASLSATTMSANNTQGSAGPPLDPALVRNQLVNLVAANANSRKPGGWPFGTGEHAATGPFSWITYDLPRWDWTLAPERRLPRNPGVEFQTDTAELSLLPDSSFAVESLGRSAARGGAAGASQSIHAVVETADWIEARSQADFEAAPILPEGWTAPRPPIKDRVVSGPQHALDDLPDSVLRADPRWRHSLFTGDLRLMDRSDPAVGNPPLYFPFWERAQPLRDPKRWSAGTVRTMLQGAAGEDGVEFDAATSQLAPRLLCCEYRGSALGPGHSAGHVYSWAGSSTAAAANPGRMPWVQPDGRAPAGAIEFWSDGGACLQYNPMRAWIGPRRTVVAEAPLVTPPSVPGLEIAPKVTVAALAPAWVQRAAGDNRSLEDAQAASARFMPGEWQHLAYAFDASGGGNGQVHGFLNGIEVLGGDYAVQAEDPAEPQDLHVGIDFPSMFVSGSAGGVVTPGAAGFMAAPNPGVDEARAYTDPAALGGNIPIARALIPRYWTPEPHPDPSRPQEEATLLAAPPTYRSALYVPPKPMAPWGARWDGFVPAALRGNGTALGAWIELYADTEGKQLLKTLPLGADGLWTRFPPGKARSFRFGAAMDASVDNGPSRDTPVFEGIELGFAAKRATAYRTD